MPVPFIDARPSECRFPREGMGVSLVVCGAAVRAPGEPYCLSCRALAYRPASASYVAPPSTFWEPAGERDTTPDLFEVFA